MIVTIHPTEMCNQNCVYCTNYKGSNVMSDDTLINTMHFIKQLPKIGGRNQVEFHSVEPTLCGLPFFIRANDLFDEFNINGDRNIATNTTSSEWCDNIIEWCSFIHDNDWGMNLSIDGPEYIHDRNRGKGNWKKVINSLINIKEHYIRYGIIAVINKGKDLNNVYDFFIDINEDVKFNPVQPFNDFNSELCLLFDKWINDHKPISIDPFTKIFNYFTSQDYNKNCPNICVHELVAVLPNGDVVPCMCFWDNSGLKDKYIYGNVNTDTFDDIWYGQERQKAIDYVDYIPKECESCQWLDLCGTGCSYAKHRGADKCGYIKALLENASWLGDN